MLNNPDFNSPEFEGIKNQAGLNMGLTSWRKGPIGKITNEDPRRKQTGYQNGIKTNLDDGGKRSFPPHPPSACLPHRKRLGY